MKLLAMALVCPAFAHASPDDDLRESDLDDWQQLAAEGFDEEGDPDSRPGLHRVEGDDCDDGNDAPGDGCGSGKVEKGYICVDDPSRCFKPIPLQKGDRLHPMVLPELSGEKPLRLMVTGESLWGDLSATGKQPSKEAPPTKAGEPTPAPVSSANACASFWQTLPPDQKPAAKKPKAKAAKAKPLNEDSAIHLALILKEGQSIEASQHGVLETALLLKKDAHSNAIARTQGWGYYSKPLRHRATKDECLLLQMAPLQAETDQTYDLRITLWPKIAKPSKAAAKTSNPRGKAAAKPQKAAPKKRK